MRDTVFISHANPQDNYFSAWLATKLNALGYQAWVDVDDFKAGDAFFTVVQPLIRDRSIRFIAVNSESYIHKAGDQNTGVSRELNTAITVKGIDNFIIPIRIDSVDFNEFPIHYSSWNTIDFNKNWQNGLIQLVDQLERMNIPKAGKGDNLIDRWFKTIKSENRVIDRPEKYYSNWFHFKFPEFIFVHTPNSLDGADLKTLHYPFVLEANRIITFSDRTTVAEFIPLNSTKQFEVTEFLGVESIEVDSSFTLIEPQKKIVKLLNQCFRFHLMKKKLSYWKKRKLNYFMKNEVRNSNISLKKRYGKGSRGLVGENTVTLNGFSQKINWHYAIIPRAELNPFPHYRINYTLVFTDQNGRGLNDKHTRTLRRSIPSDWFNRKWFELMLAAMLALSESRESDKLLIEIGDSKFLEVDNLPIGETIKKGYKEP